MKNAKLVIVVTAIVLVFHMDIYAEDEGRFEPEKINQTDIPTRDEVVAKYHSLFSEKIAFSDEEIFQCVVYIGPQPKLCFDDLDAAQLQKGVQNTVTRWSEKFFSERFRPVLAEADTLSIYLRHRNEPSLLRYSWVTTAFSLEAFESGNGILVAIGSDEIDINNGVDSEYLATILLNVFNFPYDDNADFLEALKIDKLVIEEGDVFTNVERSAMRINDWQDHIVVFAGRDAVWVILFKSSSPRTSISMIFKPDWLDIMSKKYE